MLTRVRNICLGFLALALAAHVARAQHAKSSPPPDEIRLAAPGVVRVELDDATGKVVRARMLQSTGYSVLDKATIDVYSKKHFKPHTRSPLDIPVRYSVRSNGH